MSNYRFRKGLRLHWRGRGEYVIEQRLPGGEIQIREVATNCYRAVEEQSLVAALFDGTLELLCDDQDSTLTERKAARLWVDDLNLLDEDLRKETKKRYAYVYEISKRGLTKLTGQTLKPLIEEVRRIIGDPSPPSWITLYRWHKRFLTSGEDVRALIPALKRRGNRCRKFSGGDPEKAEAVVKIINEVINEKYLSRRRPTVASVCAAVYAKINSANQYRSVEDHLLFPDKVSVYRIINRLDPFDVAKARYGERIAKEKYSAIKQGPRPTRPLERVEIDHTKLDMLVVDSETRLPIGRPWLTLALDVYSKMIVGIYISFDPPGYLTVMQCLRHAIKLKEYVKDKFPIVKNTWDTYGIPELIVCDNGPEFHSTHFGDACLQLGINIHYAPVKRGQYKGSVERYFRTLNQQLLHEHPGTTFSNILDKADYDPKKNAVISFDALLEIVHIYVVDIYHQAIHRTLMSTPAQVWKAAVAEYPPSLPPRQAELDVLLGCIEARTISTKGIELYSLFYNDERLARLRCTLGAGEKVTVKYDPTDLSVVYVADVENGKYIPVPSSSPQYTQNLTLWQHRIIRRYARLKAKDHVSIIDLSLAKEEIQKIVDHEWSATKRTNTRQRLARIKNIGQSPPKEVRLNGGGRGPLRLMPSPAGEEESEANARANFAKRFSPENEVKKIRVVSQNSPLNKGEDYIGRTSDEETELDMTGWEGDYELPN
jgi:putative transposase